MSLTPPNGHDWSDPFGFGFKSNRTQYTQSFTTEVEEEMDLVFGNLEIIQKSIENLNSSIDFSNNDLRVMIAKASHSAIRIASENIQEIEKQRLNSQV